MSLDRRQFCGASFATLVASGFAAPALADQAAVKARLRIVPDEELHRLPASYAGFSIELSTLEDPTIYTGTNRGLIDLFRCLSHDGILRIGGNSSEFCWWKPADDRQPPKLAAAGIGQADNWMPQSLHAITPPAIRNLRTFLDATGWTCIYGLNLGTGAPPIDAEEAAFVAGALGPKLRYFQIGNEPDFYREGNNRLRPSNWGFDDYLREWVAIADAISARVPQARFGGPDVGSSADWVVRFARQAKPAMGDRLVELSGHYYAEGPPESADANIANLLKTDPKIAERMAAIMPVARKAGLAFRMSETNSCFRGGKAGMSDALAAALWGMDYMLELGSRGCSGINFHGGAGNVISAALGGRMPGARNASDLAKAQLGSFYSPVAGNRTVGYRARPLLYGMMAAEQFAGASLQRTVLDTGGVNLTAYAGSGPNGKRIAIINKDLTKDALVDLTSVPDFARAALWRLAGPSPSSTLGVTLGDEEVSPSRSLWAPRANTSSLDKPLLVPRASAALLLQA